MSNHPLPVAITTTTIPSLDAVTTMCLRLLGKMPLVVEANPPFSFTFTPDLTASEADLLARIVATFTSPLFSAPDNYDAIRAEVPTLRAYYQNATPTNAQSVAAIKSIILVLRAMLRDA